MIYPGKDEPPGWRSVPVVRPGQAEQVDHVPGELWLVESGHVTTILTSDWPGAGAGAGAGHGAPDGGDGGGRHAAAAGRGAGQVSCDWRGAGHVTTVLTSDWLAGAGCSSWGYTTTPPSHRASWRSSDLSCEQFHV